MLGTVSLPSNIPIASGQYKVQAGLSESVVSVSGAFDVRIKADATSLLELVDNEEGNVVYLSLLPQDDLLAERELVLDAHSTAVAMVYLQPGITVSDPIIAAIQIALIERLPEVQALASLIEDSVIAEVPPVTSPNDEILLAVQDAIEAYVNHLEAQDYLTLNLKLCKMFFATIDFFTTIKKAYAAMMVPFNNCDTITPIFSHVGTTEDNLCVDMTGISVEQLGGQVTTTNHSCRWVFHFIDDWQAGSQVINDQCGVDGVSFPKRWALPQVHNLLVDFFKESALSTMDMIKMLFKHEEGHAIERAQERVQEWQKPAKTSFEVSFPEEGAYTFSSYSAGKGLNMLYDTDKVAFNRAVFPFLLSCTTELVFPALEIALGIGDLHDHRYWDFKSTDELITKFSAKYGEDIFKILVNLDSNDTKALELALDLAREFATDSDFIELLARNTGLCDGTILKEKWADTVQKVLRPISPLLSAPGLAQSTITILDFLKDITTNVDAKDLYVLYLESEAPTAPELLSPENDLMFDNTEPIDFTWELSIDPQDDPISYCIVINDRNGNDDPRDDITVFNTCDNGQFIQDTTYTLPADTLDYGKSYTWTVFAKDDNENFCKIVEWRNFTTVACSVDYSYILNGDFTQNNTGTPFPDHWGSHRGWSIAYHSSYDGRQGVVDLSSGVSNDPKGLEQEKTSSIPIDESFRFKIVFKIVTASLAGDGWYSDSSEAPVKFQLKFTKPDAPTLYFTRFYNYTHDDDSASNSLFELVPRNVWVTKTYSLADMDIPEGYNFESIFLVSIGWYVESFVDLVDLWGHDL